MIRSRRSVGTSLTYLVCALMLCVGTPSHGEEQKTTIESIRIGHSVERTRMVFDLSGPVSYTYFTLQHPYRLVVDFRTTDSAVELRKLALENSFIQRIRAGHRKGDRLRVVLELEKPLQTHVFPLKPYLQRGDRVVIDLLSLDQLPLSTPLPELAADESNDSGKPYSASEQDTLPPTDLDTPNRRVSELSGYTAVDTRLFPEDALYPGQDNQNASVVLELEYYLDWGGGNQRFVFHPFAREDSSDGERSHVDLRELYWRIQSGNWMLKAGLGKTFWGVAESQHLVDIINQTDLVENIDGEDKLGQPMVNLSLNQSWGTLDFYVLPYFRERTFPGKSGRLRRSLVVETNAAEYEAGSEEKHVDFAVRWSHYIGDWDVGLAHFSGTSRDPLLLPRTDENGAYLAPFYQQIDQTSLDVQATKGDWLWKLEAIANQNNINDFYAYTAGFEYTLVGFADTITDLGLILEYNYDDRGQSSATNLPDNIYTGFRWALNDTDSTQVLLGFMVDRDSDSIFTNLEASRRLGESWKLSIEARLFSQLSEKDTFYSLRDDDYIEIQLARYF